MKKYYIWFKKYRNGICYAGGVSTIAYIYKSSAVRAAKKKFGTQPDVEWIVSETNPWEKENNK